MVDRGFQQVAVSVILGVVLAGYFRAAVGQGLRAQAVLAVAEVLVAAGQRHGLSPALPSLQGGQAARAGVGQGRVGGLGQVGGIAQVVEQGVRAARQGFSHGQVGVATPRVQVLEARQAGQREGNRRGVRADAAGRQGRERGRSVVLVSQMQAVGIGVNVKLMLMSLLYRLLKLEVVTFDFVRM